MQYPQPGYPRFEPRIPDSRVNFEWIPEAFDLFKQQWIVWILASIILIFGPSIVDGPIMMGIEFFGMRGMFTPGPGGGPPPPPTPAQMLGMYSQMLPLSFANMVLLYFALCFILSGMLRIAIRQVRGEMVELSDLFRGWPNTLRLYGFTLLVGLVNIIVAVPIFHAEYDYYKGTFSMTEVYWTAGEYIALLLTFGTVAALVLPASVLIADGEKVFTAIGRSATALKHDWVRACLMMFLWGILYFVSALPCLLGIFVTIPMAVIMLALMYRDMMNMPAPPVLDFPDYGAPGVWPPPPGRI